MIWNVTLNVFGRLLMLEGSLNLLVYFFRMRHILAHRLPLLMLLMNSLVVIFLYRIQPLISQVSLPDATATLGSDLFKLYKSGKTRCYRRFVSLHVTHPNLLVQMEFHMAYLSLLIRLWFAYLPKYSTLASNLAEYLEIGGWQMSFLFTKMVINLILLTTGQFLFVQYHERCLNVSFLV